MTAVSNVEMPPRIAALPRDVRGYPIPWNVQMGKDGSPIFVANDTQKNADALLNDLCPLCGERLGKYKWFVGGPKSAFDPNGCYYDLPGHQDCIRYALQTCPWLAVPNYKSRIDVPKAQKKAPDGVIVVDLTQEPSRPVVFVMVCSSRVEMIPSENHLPYVKPVRPLLGVEYWRHGQRLDDVEGEALAKGAL